MATMRSYLGGSRTKHSKDEWIKVIKLILEILAVLLNIYLTRLGQG